MKIRYGKLLILFILITITGACSRTKQLSISGNIGDIEKLEFQIRDLQSAGKSKSPVGVILPDSSGNINVNTDTIKEGYYYFRTINQVYYLRPGMHLVFANTKEGVRLTSHPYMNKISSIYDPYEITNITWNIKGSFSEYCSKVDQFFKKTDQYLSEIDDTRFKELEQEHIRLTILTLKAMYYFFNTQFELTPEYLKVFHAIKFDKDYIALFPECGQWLGNYFSILSGIEKSQINKDLRLQLDFIKNREIKKAWAWFKSQSPDYYNQKTFRELSYAKSIVSDSMQLAGITQYLQKIKRCLKGQPAYNFEFENESGEKVKLSSLKGSYIYIDCWGTNCAPCFAQMPYLNKIEEQFKNKNIKFVSICLSKDEKRWKELLKKYDIGGIKLIDHQSKEFNDFYNINFIPRYILIDKDGNHIDAYAMRPNNEELPALFENLLKKSEQ